jgi:hypothetical protein
VKRKKKVTKKPTRPSLEMQALQNRVARLERCQQQTEALRDLAKVWELAQQARLMAQQTEHEAAKRFKQALVQWRPELADSGAWPPVSPWALDSVPTATTDGLDGTVTASNYKVRIL